ncbi:hypothetical protein FO519_004646 [Halicephalobus sp. NKZ332]|nr:hypothetical protein FO519_004646 [Halicephalobus sp. NKZ332]
MGDEAESGRLRRTRHVSSKMAQFLQETVKRKSGVSRYMGDSADGDEHIDNAVIVANEFPENSAGDRKGKRKFKNGKREHSKEKKEDSVEIAAEEVKKRSSQEITEQLIEAINEEFSKGRSKKTTEIEDVDMEPRRRSKKSPGIRRKIQLQNSVEDENEVSFVHSRPGSSADEDSQILSSSLVENGVNLSKTVVEDQVESSNISEAQSVPRYYNDAHNTSRPQEPHKMKIVRPMIRNVFIPSRFQISKRRDRAPPVPFQKIPKVVVPVQPRPESVSDQENRIQVSNTSEAHPMPRYYNDVHNIFPPREPQRLSIVKPIVRHVLAPYKVPAKKKIQIQVPLQKIQKIVPVQPRPESTSDQENWIKPHPPEVQPILMYYNDIHNAFPPAEQNHRYFYVSKDGSEFIYQPLRVHRTEIHSSEMICPPEELYPRSSDTPDAVDEVVEVNPGIFLTVL